MTLIRAAVESLIPKQVTERLPQVQSAFSTFVPSLQQGSPQDALKAYGNVGWLFATVSRIAQGTAAVDWHLYQRQANGDRREIDRHPAIDLWKSVNPFFTREEFVETFQQHLDLVGESYWVIVKPERGDLELWPIRPDRIRPIPSRDEYIAGYEYRIGSEVIPLGRDEVIFIRLPNPLDPYRGMGPVQAILSDIDSERFSAQWNRNFFINNAEPGGVVEFPEGLDDDEFERIVERWREQHKGIANAHRVAIIEKGHWVDRKFSMRDMQFEQMRRVNRDIILGAYGMPKHLLGVAEDVNRANAEAAEVVFSRWVLKPRLERIRAALNERVLPKLGGSERHEFDFDDPTPENKELSLREAEIGSKTMTLTGNEIRRRLGEGDRPEFERVVIPIGLSAGSAETKQEGRAERRVIPIIEDARGNAADRLEPQLERFFSGQSREIVARLERLADERRDEPVTGISVTELWPDGQDEELVTVIGSAVVGLATELAQGVDPLLQRGAKQRDPDVEFLLRESARRVVRINQATLEVLREALAEAQERGLSLFRTVNGTEDFRGIREIVDEIYRGRSLTIARTEMAEAANDAAQTRYRRAGVTELELVDGEEDPCCASRNGTRVPISSRPGLCHPRCTLVVLPVVALPEVAALAEAHCPTCDKLLGKDVGDATLWCRECKADVRFSGGQIVSPGVVRREIERDQDGRMVGVVERNGAHR